MLRVLGFLAGLAFGKAFPAAGILLGAPMALLALLAAALRFWPLTLALVGFMFVNHSYNHAGPDYVPPTPAELGAGVRAPLPPGAEPPRYGALLKARRAVEAEVDATVAGDLRPVGGGFLLATASLRNPSAYATLKVTAVWCEAATKDAWESKRDRVEAVVPPGGGFSHHFQMRYPYPGHSATKTGCRFEYDVVLP